MFWARGSAGAWSVLRILFGIDGRLAVFGMGALARGASCELIGLGINGLLAIFESWERWRVEGPKNLFEIDARLAVLSAGAWSILRVLLGIHDLLAVFGGWERWRVER